MAIKAFRVDTATLALIDDYLKKNPDGQQKISEALSASILKLSEEQNSTYAMLKEQNTFLTVQPKKEYKKLVRNKYGKKGPYTVNKIVESFTGRDNFYMLEGSDSLFPSDWFRELPTATNTQLSWVSIVIWSSLLFASGYSFGFLQYLYILMLL